MGVRLVARIDHCIMIWAFFRGILASLHLAEPARRALLGKDLLLYFALFSGSALRAQEGSTVVTSPCPLANCAREAVAITTGYRHTLMLSSDGTVAVWNVFALSGSG
jgi:hypothetical protein